MNLKPELNSGKFQRSIEIIPPRYKIDNKLIADIQQNQKYFYHLKSKIEFSEIIKL